MSSVEDTSVLGVQAWHDRPDERGWSDKKSGTRLVTHSVGLRKSALTVPPW